MTLGKNKDLSFKHATNLRVHHTLPTTDEVGAPGPAVTQPCTVHTCPWPKQLFLRDHLVATVSVNAKWDSEAHTMHMHPPMCMYSMHELFRGGVHCV